MGERVRRLALVSILAGAAAGPADAAGGPPPVTWPVPICAPSTIATASPAPATNDSASLAELPFVVDLAPAAASVVVGLTEDNAAVIRCVVVDERSRGLEGAAIVAVAGLKFSQPKAANLAEPGGRYLVRVSTLLGVSWVHAPPPQPLLPRCAAELHGPAPDGPEAPKPLSRVNPRYPRGAEAEGIEGSVTVRLEVFSSGAVVPACLSGATPPGWFEAAAVEAVSLWRFAPPEGPGPRFYEVTVRFRLED